MTNRPGTRRRPAAGAAGERGDQQGWALLYLVAGTSSILFVLLLIAALVLDFMAPPPVHGGAATLEFIASHKASYVAEQILWILPNVFPVLVFAALFVALSAFRKSLPLIALILGALPWALLLAVPVSSRGSLNLVYLSDRFMAAGTEEERRTYATAAEAIIAENNTPAIVGALSALGILLMGLAMLKAGRVSFPRYLAWLGIGTGALGVASEVLRHAAPAFYWGYGILLWVWFTAAGVALIRLSRRGGLASPAAEIRDFGP
ncbi:DUF4386 family protein [Arthrobacter sp. ISL-85]|uniref:DUF4386 family protein n=1 Tax=Arthrobacter sp. ISL-85 TaxID=2819115 RepID=UPI001BE5D0A7|nr:DUF4386 family protein [Arthrobacter sp. ISL-85]MBT2568863.1 DUF4386 family protein [Arthrobacter sp. ISL-85]